MSTSHERWTVPATALVMAILLGLPAAAAAEQLTVSAAASLTQAFKTIAGLFEQSRPGVTVRLNIAGSGVLLQQVAQGAPVDVLAAADVATVERGVARGLIDGGSRVDFAANALVMIEPAAGSLGLQQLSDLRADRVQRIGIGKPGIVPVGGYARNALEAAGLWSVLQPKLILADSARQVLDYVARGEVAAGFVYRTDAAVMADKVRVVSTVQGHAPIRYPAAVVSGSRRKALAQDFVQFLRQAPARESLVRFGFDVP